MTSLQSEFAAETPFLPQFINPTITKDATLSSPLLLLNPHGWEPNKNRASLTSIKKSVREYLPARSKVSSLQLQQDGVPQNGSLLSSPGLESQDQQ